MDTRPSFRVDKPVAMVDERIRISVQNLDPFQQVTLVARVKEPNADYIAHAHVIADTHGTVDLSQHASLDGTYQGTDGMGLLWSMVRSTDSRKGSRLSKKHVDSPYVVQLAAMNEFIRDITRWSDVTSALCRYQLQRWYLASDTERIKVSSGRLRGTLFVPKSTPRTAGVIDLFGSAGGLIELRASLLASHGYAVLALAYVMYEDLPKNFSFDLDYFDEAVQFMTSHPRVDGARGLGVIGVSKGAEIALHMTSHNPDIKACVSINGSPFHCFGEHTYRGQLVKVQDFGGNALEKVIETEEGMIFKHAHVANRDQCDTIPVHQARDASFLIINCADDESVYGHTALETAQLIRKSGNTKCLVKIYPGAGHLLEPPYTPLCRSVYHGVLDHYVAYGGEPRLHAAAQEDMWRSLLQFFKSTFCVRFTRVGRTPSSHL